MIQERDIHDLLRTQMDDAMSAMRAELARAYFTGPSMRERFGMPPLPAPTRRDRLRWKLVRIRTYFHTIWRAFRGDDLDTPTDCDDY